MLTMRRWISLHRRLLDKQVRGIVTQVVLSTTCQNYNSSWFPLVLTTLSNHIACSNCSRTGVCFSGRCIVKKITCWLAKRIQNYSSLTGLKKLSSEYFPHINVGLPNLREHQYEAIQIVYSCTKISTRNRCTAIEYWNTWYISIHPCLVVLKSATTDFFQRHFDSELLLS